MNARKLISINAALVALLLSASTVHAQQVADTLFRYTPKQPQYPIGKGTKLYLDEAHHNFHTTTGRFRPFVDFLRSDGYVVEGFRQQFTTEGLKGVKILVIANALNAVNDTVWRLPTPSAFSDAEIGALAKWVEQGGSLFLIADHMPFPGAAEKLAATFGIKFYNAFALRKNWADRTVATALNTPDLFTPGHGLGDNSITGGRNSSEKITSLQTFTGQAFEVPIGAVPIVTLNQDFELLLPQTAWQFADHTETLPATNLVQGAYLRHGKGRLVVFGEAAMFSAQIQRGAVRMGMNAPTAGQNAQFLLNVIHWLDRQFE